MSSLGSKQPSRRGGGRGRRLALASIAALSVACSSIERAEVVGTSQGGPAASEGNTQASAGGSGTDAGTTGAGASAGGASGGAAVAGGPSNGSGAASTEPGSTGGGEPGAAANDCSGTLTLGVSFSSDNDGVQQQLGDDQRGGYGENIRNLYQVVVDDLNARGGIRGCTVALSWFNFGVLTSEPFEQTSERECTYFAEDVGVLAAVPQVAEQPNFYSCMAEHDIPVLVGDPAMPPSLFADDYAGGYLFSPNQIAFDRLGPVIDLLHGAGYFDPGAKVGILINDDGRGVADHVVHQLWRPRLEELGIPVVAEFTASPVNSTAAVSAVAQQMSNAVLQFRGAGVTHLLLGPQSEAQGYFFLSAADAQGYHPRVGLDTSSSPGYIGPQSPPASVADAMAVSWALVDIAEQATTPPLTPSSARDRCSDLLSGPAGAAGFPLFSLLAFCDVVRMLEASLQRASGPPSVAAIREGVAALGTSFELASGHGSATFAPGVFDGGTMVRVMRFDAGSSSWAYVTDPLPIR